ncbi:MFS general substrate transporter [Metschnikowia bicuspidata var. bicuspidata NRRL YB-4993]|uniref:MFS general substrate transporter n=1 Tax=Metschnikowia bicuspidata var. bicuspidata NRRL YB-4993 TaxID=869754 RepID=A0A1A0HGF4_9ASCO|nr:MFS general substrate transporter [Metschnikowia bicuspidata var. bicuspidata NRRL YB-4993]OBA23086.1 MFS general substrate transporter [Metschnikowia bicuspidata var. bicuspidata NRRL YB-4993]
MVASSTETKQSSSAEQTNQPASNENPDYFNRVGIEKPTPEQFLEHADGRQRGEHPGKGQLLEDGRLLLREKDCYEKLGFSWSTQKKWMIISIVFIVQVSMNFNASVYPSSLALIAEEFDISDQKSRVSQMVFLIAYAFGCELWAPWSEEYGRWPILQGSLFFVNIWQILGALAPNYATVVIARGLGGLSCAGGSVTLGITADMWEAQDQGYAVAYVVLSSVAGSAVGPIFGGIIRDNLSWRWNFWIQLIFGGVVQLIHFFFCAETRVSLLIDKEAKRRRESGENNHVYGPGEVNDHKLTFKEIFDIWTRPFVMFATEPIVLFLSLFSGFSDALIFICMESFSLVYGQWGFSNTANGLAFIPILIGYFIAYGIHIPDVARQMFLTKNYGEESRLAERRMLLLLFLAPLEAIGLFGFAWTSMGPDHNPWIAPMIFTVLIAIANFSIYMSTIDYMVAAYGPYSASATGGNGFARDFLAGVSAMYAIPLYENIGDKYALQWGSTLLGFLAILVMIPIYVFYWKGPEIRARSKFAQVLAADRKTSKVDSEEEEGYDEKPVSTV